MLKETAWVEIRKWKSRKPTLQSLYRHFYEVHKEDQIQLVQIYHLVITVITVSFMFPISKSSFIRIRHVFSYIEDSEGLISYYSDTCFNNNAVSEDFKPQSVRCS